LDKIKCNIIVCGPAVGKTHLAERDKRFIDLDGMKAEYKYGLYNLSNEEKEKGKLNRGEIVNNDSTKYAIKILEEAIKNNKIVLLSYSPGILQYVIENKIKYCLVYAGRDLYEEYAERMKKRGNSFNFIEKMTNKDIWEKFYNENKNDSNPTYKVELKKGQYLSDIKNLFIK